jgi:hypothetical protein
MYQTEKLARAMLLESDKGQSAPVLSAHCSVEWLASTSATYWSSKYNTVVYYSNPDDVIYVLKKKKSFKPDVQFWRCIIGEKVGWIIVGNSKMDITPIQ